MFVLVEWKGKNLILTMKEDYEKRFQKYNSMIQVFARRAAQYHLSVSSRITANLRCFYCMLTG